ncbi:MAG: tetratricopeptide repeat protein [Nitrospirae bacterium]|nr:tetratricopeptide repeat protein [Nitrospirota bacterium]
MILLVCAAAFGNTLWCGFVSDDYEQVVKNPWLRDFGHLREIFTTNAWAMEGKLLNFYRPLMHVFYLLTFQVFGLAPWGFHLVNLLFHAGVSVLVFLVTARLLDVHRPGRAHTLPALAAAVLFAVHPIHTESVAWIGDITDLSYSLFYLTAFYLYVSYTGRDRQGAGLLAASALSFFAAALCKETALTLPLIILAYDVLSPRGLNPITRRTLYTYIPFAAAVAIYFALRFNALGGVTPVRYYEGLGAYGYMLNVIELFGRYVTKLLLPVNLNAYYVFHPVHSITEPVVLVSIAILSALVAFAVMHRRDRPMLLGLAFFVLPLLPAFYIYGIGVSVFAERYLYLPVFGAVLILAAALDRLIDRPAQFRAALALLCAVAAVYTVMSVDRNRVWVDNKTLWTDAVAKAPDAAIPHYNLGLIYTEEGRHDKAVEHLKAAVAARPDYVEAHTNLAAAYAMSGMLDDAIREGRAALALDPTHYKAWYNLGMDLTDKGEHAEAANAFMKAAEFGPDDPEFRKLLERARGR